MAISDLDPNIPTSTGPAGQGDDELRLVKSALLESFPALDGLISNIGATGDPGDTDPPDAATYSNIFAAVKGLAGQGTFQVGMIMMWSGVITEIPEGWLLCAANNAPAPDLSDRFIIGAGDTYGIGDTGGDVGSGTTGPAGNVTASVSIANHVIGIGNVPAHEHNLFVNEAVTQAGAALGAGDAAAVEAEGGGDENKRYHVQPSSSPTTALPNSGRSGKTGSASPTPLTHPDANVTIPNHSHSLTGALPPYYALAYIYYAGA